MRLFPPFPCNPVVPENQQWQNCSRVILIDINNETATVFGMIVSILFLKIRNYFCASKLETACIKWLNSTTSNLLTSHIYMFYFHCFRIEIFVFWFSANLILTTLTRFWLSNYANIDFSYRYLNIPHQFETQHNAKLLKPNRDLCFQIAQHNDFLFKIFWICY